MNSDPVTIDGTLHPDGTVRLDQMPNLSPGRVTITLQSATAVAPGQRGLAQVIDEIREGQRLRGFLGRTAEEIDAALQEGEDADEKRINALRGGDVHNPGPAN